MDEEFSEDKISDEETESSDEETESSDEETKSSDEETKSFSFLNKLYDLSMRGIPHVSPPLVEYVHDYYQKFDCPDESKPMDDESAPMDDIFWIKRLKAIRSMLNYQKLKCTTTGVATGVGGAITLPITIPVDLGNTLYIQMRMVMATALMAGYTNEEIQSDYFITFCYAILVGVSINNVLKKAGIHIGAKAAGAQLLKVSSRRVLKLIYREIGIKLTRSQIKNFVKAGKLVPVVGALIGGGFNLLESNFVAKRAWKNFIEDDPKFAKFIYLIK